MNKSISFIILCIFFISCNNYRKEIEEIEGTFVYVNTETWDTIGEGTIYWIFE